MTSQNDIYTKWQDVPESTKVDWNSYPKEKMLKLALLPKYTQKERDELDEMIRNGIGFDLHEIFKDTKTHYELFCAIADRYYPEALQRIPFNQKDFVENKMLKCCNTDCKASTINRCAYCGMVYYCQKADCRNAFQQQHSKKECDSFHKIFEYKTTTNDEGVQGESIHVCMKKRKYK